MRLIKVTSWSPYQATAIKKPINLVYENGSRFYNFRGARSKCIPQYLALLDIEGGKIHQVRDYTNDKLCDLISEIREITINVYNNYDGNTDKLLALPTLVEQYNTNSKSSTQNEIAKEIHKIQMRYSPLFIAHNGFVYDFRIIYALLRQERINTKTYRLLDSLVVYREQYPDNKDSCTNACLYQKHRKSSDGMEILLDLHQAEADVKIMACWIFNTKVRTALNDFYTFQQLVATYNNVSKRKTPRYKNKLTS